MYAKQLLTLLVPLLLLPLVTFLARPSLLVFDSVTQECQPRSDVPEAFALGVMVLMAAAAGVLTYRLRKARLQVCATATLFFLFFTCASRLLSGEIGQNPQRALPF